VYVLFPLSGNPPLSPPFATYFTPPPLLFFTALALLRIRRAPRHFYLMTLDNSLFACVLIFLPLAGFFHLYTRFVVSTILSPMPSMLPGLVYMHPPLELRAVPYDRTCFDLPHAPFSPPRTEASSVFFFVFFVVINCELSAIGFSGSFPSYIIPLAPPTQRRCNSSSVFPLAMHSAAASPETP